MQNKQQSRSRLLSALDLLAAPLLAYGQAASTTALSLSSSSVPQGTAVTLSASVQANGDPVTPGLVTFADGKTVLGSAQLLSGGTASLKVILGLGKHALTARFAGTKSFSQSSSSPQALTVTGTIPTVTTLSSSGSAGNYTLSATVTNSETLPPAGNVSFADQTNHTTLGSAALGGATTTQTFGGQIPYEMGIQPHTVAVGDFNGDGVPDLASANITDSTVSVLLGKGDGTFQGQKTYPVGNAPVSVVAGDLNGDGVPDLATANQNSNTVSVLLGSVTETAAATLSSVALVGTGVHQVAASYGGDSFHETSSSSAIPLTALPIITRLALTATPGTITAGQPVSLQASLNTYAYQSLSTNGESVTFYNGTTALGTATLNSGQPILATTTLPVGSNTIVAKFAGDGNFTEAVSNAVGVTVNLGADFTLTPIPPAETVPPSGLAGFVLAVGAVNGFQGEVTLSCSGGATGSYCANFPQTVSVSGGTAYAVSGVFFQKRLRRAPIR